MNHSKQIQAAGRGGIGQTGKDCVYTRLDYRLDGFGLQDVRYEHGPKTKTKTKTEAIVVHLDAANATSVINLNAARYFTHFSSLQRPYVTVVQDLATPANHCPASITPSNHSRHSKQPWGVNFKLLLCCFLGSKSC
ncbi:hypothetical protein O3P69_008714 [Scylla paramamosain]|uniref:Uncharacterized protein n=1 Tax=Scylla paramamosain TaxID=85552 RepID=A0AAW0SLF8_SCYPA